MSDDPVQRAIDSTLTRGVSRRDVLKAAGFTAAAGSVAAFLAACGTSASPSPSASATIGASATASEAAGASASPNAAPVEISWYVPPIFQYQFDGKTLQNAPEDWPNQAAAAFTKSHPNITVKPQVIPWDVWAQRRTAALTEGPAPDLMYRLSPDVVTGGLVDPVDDKYSAEDTGDLLPGAIEAMTREGKKYGVPWIGNPAVLVFNKSLADEKGALDLLPDGDTPRDLFWPQFIELMKKVSSKDTYGLGVAAGHWSAVIGWALGGWLKLYGAQTWSDANETKYVLHEDDNTYKALDTYSSLVDQGLLVPGTPKWEDLDQLWYRNQLLARGHWAAVDTELDAALKAGTAAKKFDLTYTLFPRAEGVDAAVDHNNDGNIFPKGTDAAKRDAAFQFAMWLGRDVDAAIGIGGNGFFPLGHAGASAADSAVFGSKPQYQWILKHAIPLPAIAKSVSGPVNNPDTVAAWGKANIDNLYYATWESIVTKQRPARDAMKELGDRVNKAIGAA
jgi:ABC-type glycerol-3-phosphate transport system substrate-binding protein